MTKSTAAVYIDGFNLYWGSLAPAPNLKWLDLVGMADGLLRSCSVKAVHYYTARIVNRPDDPGQSQRQDAYLRALRAHCGDRLRVVHGNFKTTKRSARLVRPQADGTAFVQVYRTEEKASDVNLGAQVVWDACHGLYDVACLVSNDSDLQTPVDMATRKGLQVVTVNPHLHKRQPQSLVGADVRRLTLGRLAKSRLPDPVVTADGQVIHCPPEWTP